MHGRGRSTEAVLVPIVTTLAPTKRYSGAAPTITSMRSAASSLVSDPSRTSECHFDELVLGVLCRQFDPWLEGSLPTRVASRPACECVDLRRGWSD